MSLSKSKCLYHRYRKAKNRLLKFCYVPTTSAAQNRLLFYFFAVAVYSTTEANKASLKQSIILRCLWWQLTFFCFYSLNRLIQTSQTGGQWYSDTSPFSIPCIQHQFKNQPWLLCFKSNLYQPVEVVYVFTSFFETGPQAWWHTPVITYIDVFCFT